MPLFNELASKYQNMFSEENFLKTETTRNKLEATFYRRSTKLLIQTSKVGVFADGRETVMVPLLTAVQRPFSLGFFFSKCNYCWHSMSGKGWVIWIKNGAIFELSHALVCTGRSSREKSSSYQPALL